MPSKVPLIYWDSCVFIDRIQGTSGRIDLLTELTERAERGDLKIVASTITIAEVLRGPDEKATHEEQEERIISYFENSWIELRPVDRRVAEEARRLRRIHHFQTVDAIHVATALSVGADCLHTYDGAHLLNKNGMCGNPALSIIEPRHPDAKQLMFFDAERDQAKSIDGDNKSI